MQFLEAYAQLGHIGAAAEAVDIARNSHYQWLEDPEYAKAFAVAEEVAIENLEREARRRAVDGIEEPVFQGGKKVGTITRFSDTLLIFLMKGAKPDKYRDSYMKHTGANGGPIQHAHAHLLLDPSKLTDAELEAFERARERMAIPATSLE